MPTVSPVRSTSFGDGYFQSSTFELLDCRVAVHTDDHDLVELVEELFAATRRPGAADHALALGPAVIHGRPGCFASLDGSVIVRTPARGIAFTNLMFEANQRAIECSPDSVRLHASAVATGDVAIVMPGAMGAGKSTLAAAMTQRGCDYLTDEVVALEPVTGWVRPYAKPFSLGTPPPSLRIAWTPSAAARSYLGAGGLFPPDALGTCRRESAPIGAVVLPCYERDADTRVESLDRVDALSAVATHTFHLDQPGTLGRLARVLGDVPVFRLTSGDLPAAGDAVERIIGSVLR